MAISINSINNILKRTDGIMERKEKLDRTLIKLISNGSNGLSKQSRNILDEAVFRPINSLLDELKDILNDLKDEIKREGGEEGVNSM
jgi:hypothetical protein